MVADLTELKKRWEVEQPLYEELAKFVADTLQRLVEKENVLPRITYRPKKLASLLKKIIGRGSLYDKINDKAGVRVVVRFDSEVDVVNKVIEKNFFIVHKENKAESLEYNQVGYRAFHYEVILPSHLLAGRVHLEDKICEVQVRTVSMDAWAELCHSLAYKVEFQIPKDIHRQIYSLSALFEIADKQVSSVKKAIEELPTTTTFALIANLEAMLYEFVPVDYDKELTWKAVQHLTLLLDDDEKARFRIVMKEFVSQHREKLRRIYEMYQDDHERHLFLFQPESLLIFKILETRRHDLYVHWSTRFPQDELEGLAIVWGKPYDYGRE
jgi:putative GTP pyrophosphokinase